MEWQGALESKGIKESAKKTEITVCIRECRVKSDDTPDKGRDRLKQVETFKYQVPIISENCGCEDEVRHRVGAGWGKWREMSGLVCDKRMPIMLK